ncbi:MAG: calcium-binding protein [Selenomonadaceae bacterium]|nr:calcium-binding protein [Selenomonadaceae bacterium]
MTQQEVIKTFMQSLKNTELSGRAALDEAVQASSEFKSYHELINQFMEDITTAGNWYRFLAEKCGIILDNADTGAITGADAGGTLKTATDILPAKGKAQYPEGTSFTVKGLTIYGIPPKEQLTSDQQYVIQGLYSWWIRDSLALIEESYGLTYATANNARLKMKFIDDETDNTLAYVQYDDASINMQKFEGRVLCVNMHYFQNMKKSDRHGTTDTFNLDRTLVHELVHGLMAPNINYFTDLPGALKEGGTAELIHGIDDERSYAIMTMAQNPERFRNIVMASDTSAPIEAYAGGYMLMRYFAKQASDVAFDYDTYSKRVRVDDTNFATNYWNKVTITGSSAEDTITNSGSNVSINAGADDDVIKTYVNKVTVKAGAGDDEVLNDGGWRVSISGGSGNDEITSNGKKVTIEGGTGSDEITNSGAKSYVDGGAGNDSIRNNVTGYDTLAVANAVSQEGALFAEEDMVMVGVGNSTIQAFSADLIGGTSSTLIGGAGVDSIENYARKTRIYGGDGIDAIENYGYGSKVYGDAGDDVILNGQATIKVDMPSGVSGVATVTGYSSKIYGGEGLDTITNTAGSVKVYGQLGADSITNEGIAASIYGGADNDNVINAGEKAYINLGDGDDFLENQSVSVKAVGGDGSDIILNGGDNNSLYGGAGNDHIINYGDENNFLSGGSGNDTLYSSGANATLDGGKGDDNFYNEGVNVTIKGGAGDDTIYSEGDHIIMGGGTGNDSLVNNGGKDIVYSFGAGDGRDVVTAFNEDDRVFITSGTYTVKNSGKHLVVKVGEDKLVLRGCAGMDINIVTNEPEVDWFDDDDELIAADELGALMKDDSSTGLEELTSSDATSLTPKETLLAANNVTKNAMIVD